MDSISSTDSGEDTKPQEGKGTKPTNQKNLGEKTKKDNTKNNDNKGDQKASMDENANDTHQFKKQVKGGQQDQKGKQKPTGKQALAAEKKVIRLTVKRLKCSKQRLKQQSCEYKCYKNCLLNVECMLLTP